ncbi:MAG: ankyrin repeat domain-containing protein [Oscillospiraceae bacterium]|jgi:ankyrin repeat protein|nr:ankyrin repeat domain-containing protein [Oscillospiraceae bacterium]
MKQKIVIFLAIAVAVIGCVVIGVVRWQNSPYHYSTMLREAIYNDDLSEAKRIIDTYNFDVNTPTSKPNILWDGLTETSPDAPLSVACQMGNYEMVKLLIDHGAHAKYVEGTTWPPLFAAYLHSNADNYKITKLLIENGIDVNYVDGTSVAIKEAAQLWPEEYTPKGKPVYRGVYNEQIAQDICNIVDLLLENGADINGHNLGLDYSLIKQAASADNSALLVYLMDVRGIDVNYRDNIGQTALFRLSETRSYYANTVTLLLERGADKSIKDNEGKTAYDSAIERGYPKLAKMLKP